MDKSKIQDLMRTKCPLCGHSDAIVLYSSIECLTDTCDNFSKRLFEERMEEFKKSVKNLSEEYIESMVESLKLF